MQPPTAPRKPFVHTEHGVERDDPWHWLRERGDPEVLAYIEAENAYQTAKTAHLADLRKQLFEEFKGSVQETDRTAPVFKKGFWYYHRTEEGKSYGIHCRRPETMDAPEQVLLDVNALAEGHDYTSVAAVAVSPDQRRLAYAVDHTGRELYDVVVLDLASGEVIDENLLQTSGDLTWANDSATLIYSELDDALRPWRVKRHRVGTPVTDDTVVLTESDPKFRLFGFRTRSSKWLVIGSLSSKTSEMWVIPADAPETAPRCLQERIAGLRYFVEHHGDRFFVRTDRDESVNFKLMEVPEDGGAVEDWTEVIAYRPEVQIVSVAAFSGHLVLLEREGGLAHLRVRDLATGDDHRISMPEAAYDLGLESNPTFDTTELRFGYDSMVTPYTVFAYDMATRERSTLKVTEVLGGYDPEDFRTERFTATAPDGTEIPISIVYPKDYPRDGSGKLLLYGYGSYGITIDAAFGHHRLLLLKRGVAWATAHPRGGGLLGRPWYEAGKLEHKQNTFSDFIACAEHLQREGWCSAETMATMGGSAGGLLMGAVLNQRPDLFHCAVAAVPFVDVVSTMLDEDLPLTANEWEEWGDPRQREAFDRMLAYSPYDNVEATPDFPALLITSGLNDPRVQYWEPTKWCARLRATQPNSEQILLKTHMGAGHSGQSGRYGRMEDRAYDYAWILDQLGLAG